MSLADRLRSASTRVEARSALTDANPSKAELADTAKSLGYTPYGTKADIANKLVQAVGAREDRAAITGDGWTR